MEIITSHKNTDFDALSSMVAATLLYPGAKMVIPRNVNQNVRAFLSIHKDHFTSLQPDGVDPDQVSRLIVVDTGTWHRLDGMAPLKHKPDLDVVLWDHHPEKGDISANRVCHEPMGANITLMIRALRQKQIPLTPIQSTLFLSGLHEDTGNLMFPSTQAEDALAAAFLLEQQADLNVVSNLLRPNYGVKQKDILFEMLQNERRYQINGHTVTFHPVNIEGHVGNLSIVVHMCRDIVNADAVFGIFTGRKRGKSIVIGRSAADGLNMGHIMRALGGGGHPGAGSAQVSFVPPETIEEMIRELIEGNQQASVQVSDLMSFPVHAVSPEMSMDDVGKLLRRTGVTGLPVMEGETLLGVISRRDFRKVKKESGFRAPVRAFMSTSVQTIPAGSSPMRAARLMVKYDIGRLPVVQDGQVVGIVTRSDTMRYFYDLLPE